VGRGQGCTESEGAVVMSVYRVIDVIGTITSSWTLSLVMRGLLYRTKIQLSFKYESE
jgi:hypothetical protein